VNYVNKMKAREFMQKHGANPEHFPDLLEAIANLIDKCERAEPTKLPVHKVTDKRTGRPHKDFREGLREAMRFKAMMSSGSNRNVFGSKRTTAMRRLKEFATYLENIPPDLLRIADSEGAIATALLEAIIEMANPLVLDHAFKQLLKPR
jgi:hypothetical protein